MTRFCAQIMVGSERVQATSSGLCLLSSLKTSSTGCEYQAQLVCISTALLPPHGLCQFTSVEA